MNPVLDCALEAARVAGESIRQAATAVHELRIEEKSAFDYVSRVDRDSELLIREIVTERFPQHSFLGEEYGAANDTEDAEYQWIVDPLDGTTNFLRGIPHYAVSIAVQKHGQLEHAVVYDVAKEEMFYASRGDGVFINGQLSQAEFRQVYAGALLATGVPFSGRNFAEINAFTQTMEALLSEGTSGIRRLGSAALDLAYVAVGRYDGFWEAYLKPWDIAAGALLITEAGLTVSDFNGQENYLKSGDIVAAPEPIHRKMISVTSRCYLRKED